MPDSPALHLDVYVAPARSSVRPDLAQLVRMRSTLDAFANMSACSVDGSQRLGDLGAELADRGKGMPGLGASPPCHLVDEVDGFLAIPDRVRMTAVDGADRPLDLGHLLERGGDRVSRAAEQPRTFRLAGHALVSAPVRSVRQGRVHRRGPSPAEACPHLMLAVAGDVQVVLDDIQRALAARH